MKTKPRRKPVHGIIIHAMAEYIGGVPAATFLESVNLSAHYLVHPDGTITMTVPTDRVAYHAGKSEWLGEEHLNDTYIGIEFLVEGNHDYVTFVKAIAEKEAFKAVQVDAGIALCKKLVQDWPEIKKDRVVRHSDVSGDAVRGTGRGKVDPGAGFDFEAFKNSVFT